ncbi:MAG: UDP-galactopyranose mutase [Firmicutes bacterium]|uniref:UDP-galactopyranose mutase n=1 Tax=Candidatus Stercoripulliclostridium pullicola TaxID=2840953 RepID=A0A940DHN0_9FIRM|nr:UDP-galactopyranose mutase [Candidatus Stercoripulliclostridium pullicola]
MRYYDYLIVGAGLFGAVFAERAMSLGKKVLVIDRRPNVAGNVYTRNTEGINVHVYGAHIFHTSDERVWKYVNRFASFNDYVNRVIADYNGERYSLPFNMFTFEKLWGVKTPEAAKAVIDSQIKEYGITKITNLEEQAISMVGVDVYRKLVKGYTEKQWGRKATELPPSIIKRLPLRFTYDDNYFNDKYQGIPVGGYTAMAEKMLEGADVLLSTEYSDFVKRGGYSFGKTVYTGMIDEFFGFRLGKLGYRSLRFETETLDKPDFQGNAVVNYTSYDVPYTRIIEHKYFENAVSSKTVISREYPDEYADGKEAYYTVNDEKNTALYERYRALAEEERPDVIFGGRLGEYKYYDMDKVIASALALADKELG